MAYTLPPVAILIPTLARMTAAAFGDLPLVGCMGLGDGAFDPYASQANRDAYNAMTSDQQYDVDRALAFQNAMAQAQNNLHTELVDGGAFLDTAPPGTFPVPTQSTSDYIAAQLAVMNFTPDGNYINAPPREVWKATSEPGVEISSTSGTFRPTGGSFANDQAKADYERAVDRLLGNKQDQTDFVGPDDARLVQTAMAAGVIPVNASSDQIRAVIRAGDPTVGSTTPTTPFVTPGATSWPGKDTGTIPALVAIATTPSTVTAPVSSTLPRLAPPQTNVDYMPALVDVPAPLVPQPDAPTPLGRVFGIPLTPTMVIGGTAVVVAAALAFTRRKRPRRSRR